MISAPFRLGLSGGRGCPHTVLPALLPLHRDALVWTRKGGDGPWAFDPTQDRRPHGRHLPPRAAQFLTIAPGDDLRLSVPQQGPVEYDSQARVRVPPLRAGGDPLRGRRPLGFAVSMPCGLLSREGVSPGSAGFPGQDSRSVPARVFGR